MNNYFGIDIEKQRAALLKSEVAKPLIDNIIKKADNAQNKEYPVIKMSEYMLFYETGNRTDFENKYYERRDDLASLSAALWLTNDKKYVKPLVDAIFTICDEYTWCLPAHAGMEKNPAPTEIVSRIDLANGETAKILTEIAVLNGDILPKYVNERIEYELRKRIIEGLKKECGWERSTSNWASVCSSCSASVLLHFGTEEEIKEFMPRLYKAIDNFLKGYEDDGCCKEGIIYWSYGFGHFLYFAQLVHTFTDGKKNYFDNPKIKNIAMFPQKVRMGQTKVYSVSDSSLNYYTDTKNLSFLRKIYGKDILYPEIALGTHQDNIFSVTGLLWFDTDYKADEWPFDTTYFENSQIFVKRSKKYSFAAKGGTNSEPHNHNDIGSFMIVDKNDNVPIADVGRGEYTKDTFNPDTRYTIFMNGSQGHSVPVINAKYQMAGTEYRAKNVKAEQSRFSLDIEGAYEDGIIERIDRTFEFTEDSVILNDEFDYSENTESICERLVSFVKPQICDGFVTLGSTKILFEKGNFEVCIGSESYDTGRQGDGKKTAYYIDFKPYKKLINKFRIEIKIGENSK
ncbi:MAG TPA: hypothetical protein DCO93_00205 [Clostridiales bacterium]|nr:hypothetical protein [Clostridiales bacterium]